MSLSSYADLKTAVINWSHRADLTTVVDDIITSAEFALFREVRCWDMEASLSVNLSGGVATIPSDFVELKYAYINGSPITPLEVRPAQWVMSQYPVRSNSNAPGFIAVDGGNFIFSSGAATGTLKGTYYKRLLPVASSLNALFVKNPDLYLWAALAEEQVWEVNDNRADTFLKKRNAVIDQINSEGSRVTQGIAMAVRVG